MAGKEQREEKGERGLFVGGHRVFGQEGITTSAGQMGATGLWASGGRELRRTGGATETRVSGCAVRVRSGKKRNFEF